MRKILLILAFLITGFGADPDVVVTPLQQPRPPLRADAPPHKPQRHQQHAPQLHRLNRPNALRAMPHQRVAHHRVPLYHAPQNKV